MIRFTKMQALGNDFVVLDGVRQTISPSAQWIRRIADRHRGIGCDQVLLIEKPSSASADFIYRIFNADGGEVFQCGNGARCIGLYIHQENLSKKEVIQLQAKDRLIRVAYLDDDLIQADIAVPNFDPTSLPFLTTESSPPYFLALKNHSVHFYVVSVGNPHCIIRREQLSESDMIDIGLQLNAHPAFPEGVNVGFVHYDSEEAIRLNVYERGVGMTQACGSGACAAVAVGRHLNYLNTAVEVQQPGGTVQVIWRSVDAPIQLCGGATRVFDGEIDH